MWPIFSCLTLGGRVPDQGNSGERELPVDGSPLVLLEGLEGRGSSSAIAQEGSHGVEQCDARSDRH